jgi:hypothetical protein
MLNDIALQAEGSSLLLMVPLLICCMLPMIMRMFKRRPQSGMITTESDTWFTSYKITEAFEKVKDYVLKWKKEKKPEQPSKSVFSLFKPGVPSERFVTSESVPPRLLKFSDPIEGNFSFEFTETEAGGTAVRINYLPPLKNRVQKMRSNFPLKIPLAAGTPCTACGKPVLPDFKMCPFCGQKNK